ncbi:YbaK/EbsC family protein [bacterium]|nr:YbaK/EbsC family protein [bacterium]
MSLKKIKDYLDSHQVKYVVVSHSPAYTAQEVAAYTHIPGKDMIKTVMVKIDDRMTMLVLPADHNVHFNRLREVTGANKIELANEREFKDLFPECEVGAMPPFGHLYGLPMIIEKSLTDDAEIAFNAGTHREVIKMAYNDFAKVIKATILNF